MIGQSKNIKKLQIMIENNNLSHLIIISGPLFSGKTTLAKEFCKIINLPYEFLEPKVENIREMIQNSYTNPNKKIYCIEDFESLSKAGQNAVLKIFEESPENIYFIISTNNINYMLNTILSRGILFNIEPYTKEELEGSRFNTPSKINYWKGKDLKEFDTFINDFYTVLTKKHIVEVYNLIRDKIVYDLKETGYYFLFVFEELDKKIKCEHTFKFNDFLRYNNIINYFFDKANISKLRQDNLVDRIIIQLNRLFRGA